MMFCGCTPSSMNCLLSRRNSPASSVTVVVPSPTSESCDLAMSTSVLAAGCTMSSSCRNREYQTTQVKFWTSRLPREQLSFQRAQLPPALA
jgi:hypothetical protein